MVTGHEPEAYGRMAADPRPAPVGPQPPPATVLLVDDDDDTRVILRRILEQSLLFRVVGEAAGGIEGIEKARSLRPDVVVLDLDMPGMQGGEALPLIRAASTSSRVMIYSDHISDYNVRKGKMWGAHMTRAKGAHLDTVVPALLDMLARADETDRQPSPWSPGTEAQHSGT